MEKKKISILGVGNIGTAIADGLVNSGLYLPKDVYLTRRKLELLKSFSQKGFCTGTDNSAAVQNSEIIILAVTPQQLNGILSEIKKDINSDKHIVISVVSGATVKEIREKLDTTAPIIRAMPNTAIAIRESMTCIASDVTSGEAIDIAMAIFNSVGLTLLINESLMIPATALCACGIAFFLRAIRAASQGGIEIGFHAEDALLMAAQTAKGAASLLTDLQSHPESEVDKVTTPMGCTISGLNQMEHHGFSSALIRGIITSAEKAAKLYSPKV